MPKIREFITTAILAFMILPRIQAQPVSGVYDEGLIIAYDNKTNKISGYYENHTGWDNHRSTSRFSCIFYLQGKSGADKFIKIKTWYPDNPESVIFGVLKISDEKNKLSIKLNKEHGGCWNVQHFTDSTVNFDLTDRKNWLEIRIIRAERSYFYRKPDIKTRSTAYVINGDVIKVIKNKPEWTYVEYQNYNTGKITQGWIKTDSLF